MRVVGFCHICQMRKPVQILVRERIEHWICDACLRKLGQVANVELTRGPVLDCCGPVAAA
jgi:hypothetical protein